MNALSSGQLPCYCVSSNGICAVLSSVRIFVIIFSFNGIEIWLPKKVWHRRSKEGLRNISLECGRKLSLPFFRLDFCLV